MRVSYFGLDLVIETIFEIDSNVQSTCGFAALSGVFVGMLMGAAADLSRTLTDPEDPLWPVIGLMFSYRLAASFWAVFKYRIGSLVMLLAPLPTALTVWLVSKVVVRYDIGGTGGWMAPWLARDGWFVPDWVLRRSVGEKMGCWRFVVRGWVEYVVAHGRFIIRRRPQVGP